MINKFLKNNKIKWTKLGRGGGGSKERKRRKWRRRRREKRRKVMLGEGNVSGGNEGERGRRWGG